MSANNRLTVINRVLSLMAQNPVATVNETDNSTIIDSELDSILSVFQQSTIDWKFLTETVTLSSPLAESLSSLWMYTFLFPSDYLRILEIHPPVGVSYDTRGVYLLTNSPTITFDYLSYKVSYDSFPQYFIDAFSYYVAIRLIIPLTRQKELKDSVEKDYMEKIAPSAYATEMRLKNSAQSKLNRYSRMGSPGLFYT